MLKLRRYLILYNQGTDLLIIFKEFKIICISRTKFAVSINLLNGISNIKNRNDIVDVELDKIKNKYKIEGLYKQNNY